MRTSEQTYLSKLGFNDPDRRNTLHNRACLYLGQPAKAEKLILMVYDHEHKKLDQKIEFTQEADKEEVAGAVAYVFGNKDRKRRLLGAPGPLLATDVCFRVSYLLSGGYNNNTTIGYLDLLVAAELDFERSYQDFYFSKNKDGIEEPITADRILIPTAGTVRSRLDVNCHQKLVGVEVKAAQIDVADVLQQLATYRKYFKHPLVLCTLYRLAAADKRLLDEHGYWHIYVNPDDVERYFEERNKELDVVEPF